MSPLVSTKEAAALLGVSEAAVRKWIHQGRLPRRKVGRCTRLRQEDIERFVEEGRALDSSKPIG